MGTLIGDIKRFLEVNAYIPEEVPRRGTNLSILPFVTISRQYGAGGRRLARTLLLELEKNPHPDFQGWRIFDRELCELIAEEPELRDSFNSLLSEEYHSELESLIFTIFGGSPCQSLVIRKLFETIWALGNFGKSIIVGRAAACVTRNLPMGIHLRLVASVPTRLKRSGLCRLEASEASRLLRKRDQDRAKLVKSYFHEDIDNPALYDAIWNTERVPFEDISKAVVSMIEQKLEAGRKLRNSPVPILRRATAL